MNKVFVPLFFLHKYRVSNSSYLSPLGMDPTYIVLYKVAKLITRNEGHLWDRHLVSFVQSDLLFWQRNLIRQKNRQKSGKESSAEGRVLKSDVALVSTLDYVFMTSMVLPK